MKTELLKTAFRQNAIFIEEAALTSKVSSQITETTIALVANLHKIGYTFSEPLMHAINQVNPAFKLQIYDLIKEVTGVKKNWTPLVKQWDIPTGESFLDHIITLFGNIFPPKAGTHLNCGHVIPLNTFPLERYNGCPFCGTPFEFASLGYITGQNKLKVLEIWREKDLLHYMHTLLNSPVPLDATQVESLKSLLAEFGFTHEISIAIKETKMLVIDILVEQGKEQEAGKLFQTPTDVLRYLWFKHTGFLQLVEPKTIVKRKAKNSIHTYLPLDKSAPAKLMALTDLKLKYKRSECLLYAGWLNALKMDVIKQAELMHPKRGMWVRVIRALRLAEYSKRKGFDQLAQLMDVFYQQKYEVWQGRVDAFKLKCDVENTFTLLKQRPGLFARSLFSSMLWFGSEITIFHFKEIMHEVPSRLMMTLYMYAENYFDRSVSRSVKPLGGTNKNIPPNQLLEIYSEDDLLKMQEMIKEMTLAFTYAKFSKDKADTKRIYIDPGLFKIPLAIGDRSEQIHDLPAALMGTRFPVEGEKVRLFMQWGEGLPAQHLDMDLSCMVTYDHKTEFCSFSNLVITGCKHSGDIRSIPEKKGTAEYIELDLNELIFSHARYVTFTCNAYSNGSITPNLVVGWMNSQYPMKIAASGVAYDPTAVQYQVRVKNSLVKGLVFGVLDVLQKEIIWLEMSYSGQLIQNIQKGGIYSFLKKLDAKIKIGELLQIKAKAQNLQLVDDPSAADEVYDLKWSMNAAEVSKVLLG